REPRPPREQRSPAPAASREPTAAVVGGDVPPRDAQGAPVRSEGGEGNRRRRDRHRRERGDRGERTEQVSPATPARHAPQSAATAVSSETPMIAHAPSVETEVSRVEATESHHSGPSVAPVIADDVAAPAPERAALEAASPEVAAHGVAAPAAVEPRR